MKMGQSVEGSIPSFYFERGTGEFDGETLLKSKHLESMCPDDSEARVEILKNNSGALLHTCVDGLGRGELDGGVVDKYMVYSFNISEKEHIVTLYQAYGMEGRVIVDVSWHDEGKIKLAKVDMYHVPLWPERASDRLVIKHLERISGKELQVNGLKEKFEELYWDMFNWVPCSYGNILWSTKVQTIS